MDLYCRRCGEPWDSDSLHDEVRERVEVGEQATYEQVAREFVRFGCAAFHVMMGQPAAWRCELNPNSGRASASGALMDVMPDDLDAVASTMEEAERLGIWG